MSDKKAPPTFIVYLNGSRMDPELEGRIKKIAITEKIDQITTVKIKFADAIPHVADNDELTPGSEIKIEMGYLHDTDELFNGEITAMKIALIKGNASTCTITAQNHLHRLVRVNKSRFFAEMTDTDIIKQIADEACLGADVDDVGTEHVFVAQKNQSDFDYIMEMAERFNCHVWSEDKKLFFKQNQGSQSEDVVLEQDKTLITFHATRQTESLITEATVVSWDVDKQEAITGTVTAGDISGNGPQLVQDSFGDRVNVVTNRAAIDNNAAEKLAKDILVRNAREFVRATGESEGNIEIRAGSILRIEAVGQRMSNCYQVVSVQHIIDAANHGYVTRFELVSNVASDTSDSSSSDSSSSQSDDQEEQAQDDQEEEAADTILEKENIEFQCFDTKNNPIIDIQYLLSTPDGDKKGKTDKDGIILIENITEGNCSLGFYLNKDNDRISEFEKGKTYETGKKHIITFPCIELNIEINPNDASTIDDKYTLFSTDEAQTYKKIFTIKDDKYDNNDTLDLIYYGVNKDLNYTLEIDPGSDGEKYQPFTDISYKDLE